jgi:hypothetical protein
MLKSLFTIAAIAIAAVWPAGVARQGAAPASIDALLDAAARYVEHGNDASGIVIAESYVQQAETAQWLFSLPRTLDPPVRRFEERRLESDVFVIWDPEQGLTEWRDVHVVDGRRIPGAGDRVTAIERSGWAQLRQEAQEMTRAASRFNLNPEQMSVARTSNLPFAAVALLQPANRAGMDFSLEGERRVYDVSGQVLRFQQRARIRVRDTTMPAADGRVVIDPATGAVLAADVTLLDSLAGAVVRGTLRVTFRPDTSTSFWVPDVMTERYDILNDRGNSMGTITGRAAYSNARRFTLSEHADGAAMTP